jgi:hypothetical protein
MPSRRMIKRTPLTKADMYDKDGNCLLPKVTPKKYISRSKYSSRKDTPKSERIIK